jgi:hypothetical protein
MATHEVGWLAQFSNMIFRGDLHLSLTTYQAGEDIIAKRQIGPGRNRAQ